MTGFLQRKPKICWSFLKIWIIWKDDVNKKEYAKVSGISAIIGVALYALLIGSMVALSLLGVDTSEYATFPFSEMMAMINLYR